MSDGGVLFLSREWCRPPQSPSPALLRSHRCDSPNKTHTHTHNDSKPGDLICAASTWQDFHLKLIFSAQDSFAFANYFTHQGGWCLLPCFWIWRRRIYRLTPEAQVWRSWWWTEHVQPAPQSYLKDRNTKHWYTAKPLLIHFKQKLVTSQNHFVCSEKKKTMWQN